MSLRKSISKKTRFELFKRDSFTCQYCGQSAPDVVLEPDHINPVSNGGDNDLMNLVTSCFDCNRGKGKNLLSDKSVIEKQRKQLQDLNERRSQLEMMLQWRESLKTLGEDQVEVVARAFSDACNGGSRLNEKGLDQARKLIEKHGLSKVLDAIDIAKSSYLMNVNWADDSANEIAGKAWIKVGGIARVSSKPEAERRLYYIRGILRNRLSYINETNVMRMMKNAIEIGVDVQQIEALSKEVRNWTQFQTELYQMMDEAE